MQVLFILFDMKLEIRPATVKDIPELKGAAQKMSSFKDDDYFEKCFERVAAKERDIFVAIRNEILVGYVMLIWTPRYQPFRSMRIPEVQDLNVVPSMRRQGVAGKLMDYAEGVVRKRGLPFVGIGVGLHSSYGPAQRLYIKRGYVPDGAGAAYDAKTMEFGEMRPLDDNFTIKLLLELSS